MKTKIIPLLLAVTVASGGVAAAKRPDWRFIAEKTVKMMLHNGSLPEKTGVSARKYTLDELHERDDITFSESMMLVNTGHSLDESYIPVLIDYKDTGILVRQEFADAFSELNTDLKNHCGEGIYFSSGYRSFAEQQQIFDEQGSDTAQPAGASEHMTGLAADVYVNGFAGEAIIKSKTGRYMNNNCSKFGLIIRYPFGKKDVTGISYEPWHIRYVGIPHSEIITANDLTLEEYQQLFEFGEWYTYGDYLISRQKGEELFVPDGFEECTVSPDNCGGYFLTVKR